MSIEFRPAVREKTSLLIALAGPSGCGKTMSALRLATGLKNGGKIAFIDTEARRALHYADQFEFDHCDFAPPFRPDRYREVIETADDGGYDVIILDSMSHVWSGDGGIIDWHEEEVEAAVERSRARASENNWRFDEDKTREKEKLAGWVKPKTSHKRMVSRLLQCRAHLIFCLRAEEKMLMTSETDERTGRKKAIIVAAQDRPLLERWQPICEKNFMYEQTASFLLLPGAPGVPHALKLQDQHREAFPAETAISEASGAALRAWASGGKAPRHVKVDPLALAEAEARKGIEALKTWWGGAGKAHQRVLKGDLDRLKKIAADADAGGLEVEEEVAFDEAGRAEADSDGDRKPPQADREGADTGGKPSGDGLSASRRDHIVKLIQAAGPDAACVDAVIRDNGPVLQELAPKDYDAVMEASLERKDVLRADADRVAAE